MSFDAFCYSTTDQDKIPGETQDEFYMKKKAFEILSFELGATWLWRASLRCPIILRSRRTRLRGE